MYSGKQALRLEKFKASDIGGLDKDGNPKDTRTQAQKEALYNLVGKLMLKYDIDVDSIHCHYEFANKACPCFKIEDFINEFNDYIRNEMG